MLVPLHCCSGTAVELQTDKNPPEFAKKAIHVEHEQEAQHYAGCQTQHNMKKGSTPPRPEIEFMDHGQNNKDNNLSGG